MPKQTTNTVFLVRPAAFGYNHETAGSNRFQEYVLTDATTIQAQAIKEFDAAVAQLRAHGVKVYVFEDTAEPPKPDAVFPNNWISVGQDGRIILYPMYTPNRQAEVRADIVEAIGKLKTNARLLDWSVKAAAGQYLEGTGSVVFDHINKMAYACLSPRTHITLLNELVQIMGYQSFVFNAFGADKTPIYHTNVMMAIGEGFAVVCMESIDDMPTYNAMRALLDRSNLALVDISLEQMANFAGNMLALNVDNQQLLVMSERAYNSLDAKQLNQLEHYATLVPLPIPTIERIGGGSARCMIGELFL